MALLLLQQPRGPTHPPITSRVRMQNIQLFFSAAFHHEHKNSRKEINSENSTMNGNPLYRIIDSLVLLIDPDAVLLELRPNKLHWQFTLVRMRNRGATWW